MTATWGDLFERATAFDVSEADVRRAVAERRDAADGGESDESDEPVERNGDDGTER